MAELLKDATKNLKKQMGTLLSSTSLGRGVHPTLKKGYLVNEDTDDVLYFQYNPESYYTEHGATYETIDSPGTKYPYIFYGGKKLEKIPLTLYFYGVNNVSGQRTMGNVFTFLKDLTKPSKKQKNIINGSNHFISPPLCTFVFGPAIYTCVVENLKLTRTMFNPSLRVMQTQVDLTLIKVNVKKPATKAPKAKLKKTTTGLFKGTKVKKSSKKKYYTVPKNSKITLASIAKKYGTTKAKLKKLNKSISKKTDKHGYIKTGTKVRYK